MPKLGMEPRRRTEAINAALECICEHGIDQITLDMVALKAGFSKGIVTYYFKSKRQLLLECLKAFMASYSQKSLDTITPEMTPGEMLDALVEISLPPLQQSNQGKINVFSLPESGAINLPENKMAQLSLQFLSIAMLDQEFQFVFQESNNKDVAGIASIFCSARGAEAVEQQDSARAYALLAMLYGLSFFRVMGHLPPGQSDNREIGFEYTRQLIVSHAQS